MKRVEPKVHPITRWDAGNVLTKLADDIDAASADLKDFPEIQARIQYIRKELSQIYDDHDMVKEMGFGI